VNVLVAKDSLRITDGELQRLVESNQLVESDITTCCLGGFQDKSSSLIQEQTPANLVVRHDWIFKRDRLLWSDET